MLSISSSGRSLKILGGAGSSEKDVNVENRASAEASIVLGSLTAESQLFCSAPISRAQ